MRATSRPLDIRLVVATTLRLAVPTWFIATSALRLLAIADTPLGYDGRLYRAATVAWLAGGDPWQVQSGGVYFAAPPPTLVAMLPFALVPEPVAVVALLALGVGGTLWALRRLRMPLWWLAFPPLVDGLYNANPHVLLLPLMLSGVAFLAPLLKVYAAPAMLLRRQFRPLVIGFGIAVVAAPFTAWGTFIGELPRVLELLRAQTGGGLSVWNAPLLALPAGVALWVVGRERAAWWIVPVFWPSTQYYYDSLAMPALTPLAAIVMCGQFPGVPAVAAIVSAVEVAWMTGRLDALLVRIGAGRLGRAAWLPSPVPATAEAEGLRPEASA